MLDRHDAHCVLEDESEKLEKPETIEQEDADKVSDRDYQAGFWSPPN
ncbi:hypothetical protein [Bosea sp. AAP35]|nr:hypothetical protein [Bosea sp. AAP35]